MGILYSFLIFFIIILVRKNDKNLLNPVFIVLLVWFIFPLVYGIFTLSYKNMISLSYKFYVYVLLYLMTFLLFYYLVKKIEFSRFSFSFPAFFSFRTVTIICVLANFIYMLGIFNVSGTYNIINAIKMFRIISLNFPERITVFVSLASFFSSLTLPLIAAMILYDIKVNKVLQCILYMQMFVIPVLAGSKSDLFKNIILLVGTLYLAKKIKFKEIIIISIVSILLLLFSIVSRDFHSLNSEQTISNYLFVYAFASLPAFDNLLNGIFTITQNIPGEHVFYFIYKFINKIFNLGLTPMMLKNNFEVQGPDGLCTTNVFTALGMYYADLGVQGIILYGVLMGIFTGVVYKMLNKRKNVFWYIFYLNCLYGIIFQFFGDMLFMYFVTILRDAICLLIVLNTREVKNIKKQFQFNFLMNQS